MGPGRDGPMGGMDTIDDVEEKGLVEMEPLSL